MHSIRSNHKDFLRSQTLTRRRKKRKMIKFWTTIICVCILFALIAWVISLESMAIKKIVVVGNVNITSEEIQHIGDDMLNSKYIGLFSKRNAFLYPKRAIVRTLTETYPRISAVGVDTESFEILNIKIKEREAVSVWCAAVQCYLVDDTGYIFAEYHEDQTKGPLILPVLYGGDQFVGPEPIGKKIFNEKLYDDLRNILVELHRLGLSIKAVHVYSRDEIVFTLVAGGKIIFSDRKPFEVSMEELRSSLKSTVFTSQKSGVSFEYIDVRFGNKVFYKLNKSKEENSLGTSSTSKSNI